jgi:L-iditol 2-dehydrogenase
MNGSRVVWRAANDAGMEEVEIRDPSRGEVRVRSAFSLISPGTERAFFTGAPDTPGRFPMYPPGNSTAGCIDALGVDVQGLEIGDRVVVRAAHASSVVEDASQVVPIPSGLAMEEALFSHLASIALQGVRKGRVEIGDRVAVIGAGLIGLLAIQWARVAGASRVIAVDLAPDRRELAQSFGADEALEPGSPEGASNDVSLVIEATGAPSAIVEAFSICGARGRVVLLGSTRGPVPNVDFYGSVHKKGLEVIGAHQRVRPSLDRSPGMWTWRQDMQVALDFLLSGRVTVDGVALVRCGPDRVADLYDALVASNKLHAPIIAWADS